MDAISQKIESLILMAIDAKLQKDKTFKFSDIALVKLIEIYFSVIKNSNENFDEILKKFKNENLK
jgi:hypothetical protein